MGYRGVFCAMFPTMESEIVYEEFRIYCLEASEKNRLDCSG